MPRRQVSWGVRRLLPERYTDVPITPNAAMGDLSPTDAQLAEHIVSPWVGLLPNRCEGPHLPAGPDGSYSIVAANSRERVAKVFLMEDCDPLPPGVYIGIRFIPLLPELLGDRSRNSEFGIRHYYPILSGAHISPS